jgi:hypothetical protein
LQPTDSQENIALDDVLDGDKPDPSDYDSSIQVNDPDAICMPKDGTSVVNHFFDKTRDKTFCIECQ